MKRLTVSKLWRQSGRRGSVPHVRLTGHWLARLGFEPGSKVNVRVEGSSLVLEVAR
jgi:antitoxin component of MazEF toxin-antitoxin module